MILPESMPASAPAASGEVAARLAALERSIEALKRAVMEGGVRLAPHPVVTAPPGGEVPDLEAKDR